MDSLEKIKKIQISNQITSLSFNIDLRLKSIPNNTQPKKKNKKKKKKKNNESHSKNKRN